MENEHDQGIPSILKLNVGGHYFTTSPQTLTKDPDSMLAIMFSGKYGMKRGEDGAIFIDRDGTHFRFILNYLRTGKITLPEGGTALKELMEEAEFYQIQGILDELKSLTDNLTIVKLNVGGHHFTTSLQTLTKDPNSKLAAMFAGEHINNGTFIIDRDGTHFRYILNYLRDGDASLPEEASAQKQLEAEAEFYEVNGLLMKLSIMSEIITNQEHTAKLLSFLPLLNSAGKRHHLRLLFRASRDGFFAKAFHSICDNQGPTVTIVQSGEYIFGGFTDKSWKNEGDFVRCSKAFLFSLVNPQGLQPVKMPINSGGKNYGICCYSEYGPTFGKGLYGGYALKIADHANVCTSDFGISDTYDFQQDFRTFFTGKTQFLVTDYEVFSLVN